jgi:hypothetical protein
MNRGSGSSAVDRYVDLPYHITLVQDGEADGGKWIAAAEELPDCRDQGRNGCVDLGSAQGGQGHS